MPNIQSRIVTTGIALQLGILALTVVAGSPPEAPQVGLELPSYGELTRLNINPAVDSDLASPHVLALLSATCSACRRLLSNLVQRYTDAQAPIRVVVFGPRKSARELTAAFQPEFPVYYGESSPAWRARKPSVYPLLMLVNEHMIPTRSDLTASQVQQRGDLP